MIFITTAFIIPLSAYSQAGIEELSEDTLSTDIFYYKKFLTSGAEEFADGFFNLNDFQHLDLASNGQFSGLSYRGTDHRNLIPILNGIPLESVIYGSPDLFSIPYFVIDKVDLKGENGLKFPGIYQPVYISSKKVSQTVPFSRLVYRFGDYAFNHVDVTLSRYFTKNLSVFASGSKDDYPDRYQDNDMRGSKYWLDMNYKFRRWNIDLLTFVSDHSVNYDNTIPVSYADTTDYYKETPRGNNLKFISLKINNDSLNYYPELSLYLWNMKEQSTDSTFYHRKFRATENVIGIQSSGEIPELYENIDIYYRGSLQRSNVTGGFAWDRGDALYTSRLSMTINSELNDKVSLHISPEITWMTDQDICIYNLFELDYRSSERIRSKLRYRRSGRYLSLSEKYFSNPFVPGTTHPGVPDKETINSMDFKFLYKFKKGFLTMNPFLTSYKSALYSWAGYDEARVFRHINGYIGDISNLGINIDFRQYFNHYVDYGLNYNFLNSDIPGADPVNSASFQLNLRNLEDIITSKNVDTEINITGKFIQSRLAMNYLPLYRLFAYTGDETPSVEIFKIRGCAHIGDISFFQEVDIYSDKNYQPILGYKRARQFMVRIGVTWNFYN